MLDGAQSAFGGSCPCLGIYGKRAAECSITTLSLLFLQAVLEQTNYATFQALLQFAATAHQDPNSSNSFAQRRRIIPTALTFAGGVNSADHAQTFPTLVNLLRQQVRLTCLDPGFSHMLMVWVWVWLNYILHACHIQQQLDHSSSTNH